MQHQHVHEQKVFAGVMRLLVIRGLSLGTDVNEYGVHWNFFFTVFGVNAVLAYSSSLQPIGCLLAGERIHTEGCQQLRCAQRTVILGVAQQSS